MQSAATASHEVVTLLKDLVRFPSLSGEESAIASFVEQYVRATGLPVRRFGDNVYFWLGEGKHRLLLNSHLDVVPPSSEHPFDPFDPVEHEGFLYGRGSVDAKGCGASMTMALIELAREGWTPRVGQVMVALTTCEEVGEEQNGLRQLRPNLPAIHAAIVGEPTELQPAIAQKGLLILKAIARGRTAHAARAHLGSNAILKAARDIQRLTSHRFHREVALLTKPTISVTCIEGGTARNVVPDQCSFYIDIRTTPAYTHQEIIAQIDELLESEVSVHSKRIIPVSTPGSAAIVQACLSALPNAAPFASPTASDWLFLHDVPTVKIGPGMSERSHTPDERIEITEVIRAVDAYKGIIKAYYNR